MRRLVSHLTGAIIEGALISLLVIGLIAAPAFAAKGNGGGGKPAGGGSSSLSLVVVSSPYNDGLPHYNGQVTFNVSTTATSEPSVKVICSQGGTVVYQSSAGFYPDYPWPWLQTFNLKSMAWTGGAADCTAELYYWNGRRFVTLTSLSFHADA